MPSTAPPLLSISDLSITFQTARGDVEAVREASLTVEAGRTVALVGESGSGKSTLTSALNRLLARNGRVTGGSVVFDGVDILALSEKAMSDVRGRQIGLVPQDPMSNLNPLFPVGRQIAEIFAVHKVAKGKEAKRRSVELLEMVGIDDPERRFRQYPHEFSGGMRQRVLIAMGLACRPKLLIADEPTSALDVTVQKKILDELAALTASMGTAVVMVTHDLALAAERADHVVVMNKGRIVESGPAQKVLAAPQDDYTKRLIAAAPNLTTGSLIDAAPTLTTGSSAGEGGAASPAVAAKSGPLVEVVGLRKEYQVRTKLFGKPSRFTAVDDVSFTIPRGKTVGIVGESGSGKSTTAKMLLRLEQSTRGDILFQDDKVTHVTGRSLQSFRRKVQPVFQNPYAALDPRYTVGDAIREPLDVHRVGTEEERARRVHELLEQVALAPTYADRYPHELSGGQRQRVAIARALALDPELVVLDEAVSALDVLVQAQILDLLVDLQARLGLSYLFISHDLAVIRMICHEVHVMKGGRIVESGTPEEIFERPQAEYTRTLLSSIPTGHH
ncbi:ABC transporter ATP-binding protein [Streptomyces fuscichromogenes]|uniref:ABC transporter ATP-binding protein n=1 Tax=Streptomyces fuscichromogenes TaxID=1324013 RepID=UPI00382CC160